MAYIYIHIDPGAKELLYVGISAGNYERVRDFYGRKSKHRMHLKSLLSAGYSRSQIGRIVVDNITIGTAPRAEKSIIELLSPPFNIQGRVFELPQN